MTTDTEGLIERVADKIEEQMGPVFGSPEYLADPVKLARAEKRRHDTAVSLARIAIAALQQPDERDAEIAGLREALAKLNRRATDRQYMIDALVQMLGPKALQVWQHWQSQGVQRVHHDWGPNARNMSGEERAEVLLAWEDALNLACGWLEELHAFRDRVVAAVEFAPHGYDAATKAAVIADLTAGMSLRQCAAKHGLSFAKVRGIKSRAIRAALKADKP